MKDWLNFEYFNIALTAHGGTSLLKRFLDRTGIIAFMNIQSKSKSYNDSP